MKGFLSKQAFKVPSVTKVMGTNMHSLSFVHR